MNNCDESKNTALHVAARRGHIEMVSLLMEHGANQFIENMDQKTAACISIEFNHKEVFELLVRLGAKLHCNNGALLYKTISADDLDFFCILLNAGANLNASTGFGRTALHQAVVDRNVPALELLLSQGANINQRDHTGRTPLHLAIDLRKEDIFKILLHNGADVNSRDYRWQSPLHSAVRQNCLSSVRLLLKHGANVNSRDINNQTPLHLIRKSNVQILKELLFSGQLNVNAVDVKGHTPLHLAINEEHKKLMYIQPEDSLVARLVATGADVTRRMIGSN